MGYKLQVIDTEGNIQYWENFGKIYPLRYPDMVDILREEYRCRDMPGTFFIEFDGEEDMMVFKLKFG